MGIAIRTKTVLDLDLPSFVWKPLVGEEQTRNDLESIDFNFVQVISFFFFFFSYFFVLKETYFFINSLESKLLKILNLLELQGKISHMSFSIILSFLQLQENK